MNHDFHYYGTYVAARLAGYDFESAETLAHAAQYVDDSIHVMLDKDCLKGLVPIPTSHSMSEFTSHDLGKGWTEDFLNETARVWPVFHFLPGNIDGKEKYMGPQSDKGLLANWMYDDEAKEQFKLMCLPNSTLVKEMVNDLRKNSTLQKIGIRMHVLADTWAHMYFSGVPARFTNRASDFKNLTAKIKNPIETPDLLFYNSYFYLGHATAGNWPDFPYMRYKFRPQWDTEQRTKDNLVDYMLAIKQLTEALTCIRTNKDFKVESYAQLSSENEAIIKEIFDTQVDDQSSSWKRHIPKIKVAGMGLKVPADYDANLWLTIAKKADEDKKKSTDYYQFNQAAIEHLSFVKNSLQTKGVYLDNIPQKRIVKCKIKTLDGKYISTVEKKDYAYPTLGDTPVVVEIVLPVDKLLAGTIVKLRTSESRSSLGDHVYLGAWTSPWLYYYTRDFNLFNQKWCIEQEGKKAGSEIDFSKPVMIKNQSYLSKPFMAPIGKRYLTTKSKKYYFMLELV